MECKYNLLLMILKLPTTTYMNQVKSQMNTTKHGTMYTSLTLKLKTPPSEVLDMVMEHG
jgi:hypothetical protein